MPAAYRMRAEFRLWHDGDDLYYAMFDPRQPKTPQRVTEFPIASRTIQAAMPRLLRLLHAEPVLRRKLFQVEFLSGLSGQLLVSLIYHRALTAEWLEYAQGLAGELGVQIVGRSRKHVVAGQHRRAVVPKVLGGGGPYHKPGEVGDLDSIKRQLL